MATTVGTGIFSPATTSLANNQTSLQSAQSALATAQANLAAAPASTDAATLNALNATVVQNQLTVNSLQNAVTASTNQVSATTATNNLSGNTPFSFLSLGNSSTPASSTAQSINVTATPATALQSINDSNGFLSTSNLPQNTSAAQLAPPTFNLATTPIGVPTSTNNAVDFRIRIRPQDAISSTFYGGTGSLLAPLKTTNGMIFPFTPLINYQQPANYSQMSTTHANQDYYFYKNTPSLTLTISGEFTAQNQDEAKYMLAAIHFLRTVTKMHFGDNDPQKGLPPPVLLLSGYGDYMFNDLPVIVTAFSVELPKEVDYVQVAVSGQNQGSAATGTNSQTNTVAQTTVNTSGSPIVNSTGQTWVPSLTNISVTLVVQNTPKYQRTFNWDQFASGALMKKKGWI